MILQTVLQIVVMLGKMSRDDLFVVHETFWTDSCMYADIVLPADLHLNEWMPLGIYGWVAKQLLAFGGINNTNYLNAC